MRTLLQTLALLTPLAPFWSKTCFLVTASFLRHSNSRNSNRCRVINEQDRFQQTQVILYFLLLLSMITFWFPRSVKREIDDSQYRLTGSSERVDGSFPWWYNEYSFPHRLIFTRIITFHESKKVHLKKRKKFWRWWWFACRMAGSVLKFLYRLQN